MLGFLGFGFRGLFVGIVVEGKDIVSELDSFEGIVVCWGFW